MFFFGNLGFYQPWSKSCQLLHNSIGTSCRTNPEQIEVKEFEG